MVSMTQSLPAGLGCYQSQNKPSAIQAEILSSVSQGIIPPILLFTYLRNTFMIFFILDNLYHKPSYYHRHPSLLQLHTKSHY